MRKYTLKEFKNQIIESHDEECKEQYNAHHERAVSYLQKMISHLNDHKKTLDKHAEKEDWHVRHPHREMKDFSRRLEDMAENMEETFTTDMPADNPVTNRPKNTMSGTRWGNYKVNK